jgi:hypothetical protein
LKWQKSISIIIFRQICKNLFSHFQIAPYSSPSKFWSNPEGSGFRVNWAVGTGDIIDANIWIYYGLQINLIKNPKNELSLNFYLVRCLEFFTCNSGITNCTFDSEKSKWFKKYGMIKKINISIIFSTLYLQPIIQPIKFSQMPSNNW